MTKIIEVVQNDQLYNEHFTLNDADGNPIDITGCTLTLKVQAAQDRSETLKFSGSMTIVLATAGTCYYTVQPTDFDTVGTFNAEILVAYAFTPPAEQKKIRYTDIQIVVRPSLPR